MASVVDAFNEALCENLAIAKIIGYAIPVYFVTKWFIIGQMNLVNFWGVIFGVLFVGLLTQGINNVRMNRREVLTINPVQLGLAILKAAAVLIPNILVFGFLGYFLVTKVEIPINLPHVPQIFAIIVWSIVFSIVLTAYLSFAKYLRILQGFNYKLIFESCIDILVSFLFFIPQLLVANFVLIGPVAYLFSFFNVPFNNWGFVAYCSAAFVVNVSMLANYFAQASYEHIKGNNEEYDENVQINVIDDASTRLNGN